METSANARFALPIIGVRMEKTKMLALRPLQVQKWWVGTIQSSANVFLVFTSTTWHASLALAGLTVKEATPIIHSAPQIYRFRG